MDRIEIICPNCRAAYIIARQFSGRYAKCKKCGQSFLAAESDRAAEVPLDELRALADPGLEENEASSPPAIESVQPPPLPAPPRIVSRMPLVEITRVRARSSINFDWLAPTLIFILLGLLLLIGLHLTVGEIPFFRSPPSPVEHKGYVWLTLVIFVICFFAIIGPAVWSAVMAAARMGHEDPGYSSYLRASSIAAIPLILFYSVLVIRWDFSREVVLIGLAIALPLMYLAMKLIFDFEAVWTFVAVILVSLFFIPAMLVSGGIVKWTIQVARGEGLPALAAAPSPSKNTSQNNLPPVSRTPPEPPTVSLRHRLEAFRDEDFASRSREASETRLTSLRRDIDSLKAVAPNDGEWPVIESLYQDLQAKVASAVSAKPDAKIFTATPPGKNWTHEKISSAVEAPVSFKAYHVRPPAEAKLDLASSEDGKNGLIWTNDAGSISFRTLPVGNPRQQQPWVMNRRFMQDEADAQSLFAVLSFDGEVTSGRINGIPFVRIQTADGRMQTVQYVAREPNDWLIIEIRAQVGPSSFDVLEASACAIARAPQGEAKIDPFSIDRVALRLADDATNASRILIRHGKAAEDAVLKVLETGDSRTKLAAIGVLKSIGTEKSLEQLELLAKSRDSWVSDAAKAAMQRISPQKIDPVAVAMLDLEANSSFKRSDAIKALIAAKPDDRREKVAAKLEGMVLGDSLFPNEYDDLSNALAIWSRKETAANLLPVLDEQHGSAWRRRGVMKILAKLRDPKAAYPICRWVILDTQEATAALIEMGPVAEDEVIKLLREKNATARMAAARVLERIGTAKCTNELYRASNDPRDKPAAEAAKAALDSVKARLKAQKEATTTPSQ